MLSFLGILTLQVGVLVLATSFTTLAICSILTNMLKLDSETPLPWVIMLLCSIYVIITWSLSIAGAVSESFKLIRSSLFMWTIFIIVWISLFIWSTFPSGVNNVCVGVHCPESLWLVDNAWQKTIYCDEAHVSNSPTNSNKILGANVTVDQVTTKTLTVKLLKFRDSDVSGTSKVIVHQSTESNEYYDDPDNRLSVQTFESNAMDPIRTQGKKNKYRSQQSAIIIMVLTLLMFISYFVFSWVILRSYMRCLKLKAICAAARITGQPCVNEMQGSC